MIPDDVIRQVLDRNDIVDVVSSYIPLKQSGRNFKALSPFKTEKTPSFFVNPQKQIYHCFSTDKGGNAITFVMEMERLNFPEAVRLLADKAGVVMPENTAQAQRQSDNRRKVITINECAVRFFHERLLKDRSPDAASARDYLKSRGIALETVKLFKVGFAPDLWDGLLKFLKDEKISLKDMEMAGLVVPKSKGQGYYDRFRNRVMFPIFDARSQCVGFGGRTLEKDNPVKYVNSPETAAYSKSRHVYGLHKSKEDILSEDEVIVTEGYMDFVMPYQFGVTNVVASLGTALTTDQIRLLRRYTKNIVLLYDNDDAGQAAMLRSIDTLIEEDLAVRIASLSEGEDPDSYLTKNGVDAFRERVKRSKSLFEYKLDVLKRKHPAATVESRAAIAAEMLPTLKKVQNAVVQSEYIKRLAGELFIDQDALLTEMKKVSQGERRAGSSDKGEENLVRPVNVHPVERDLITILVHHPDLIPLTQKNLELSELESEPVKVILSKIFETVDQGEEIRPSVLLSSIKDQPTKDLLTKIAAQENSVQNQPQKILLDCLQRIRVGALKRRRTIVRQAIGEAENRGDQNKSAELTQQFQQITSRLTELSQQFKRMIKG